MTAPIRPRAREDLTVVELDGEAVIYDEDSGELHHLNPTATVVFDLLDGTGTIHEIAADISEAFGASVDRVERDVRALVRAFRRTGLIHGTDPVLSNR